MEEDAVKAVKDDRKNTFNRLFGLGPYSAVSNPPSQPVTQTVTQPGTQPRVPVDFAHFFSQQTKQPEKGTKNN